LTSPFNEDLPPFFQIRPFNFFPRMFRLHSSSPATPAQAMAFFTKGRGPFFSFPGDHDPYPSRKDRFLIPFPFLWNRAHDRPFFLLVVVFCLKDSFYEFHVLAAKDRPFSSRGPHFFFSPLPRGDALSRYRFSPLPGSGPGAFLFFDETHPLVWPNFLDQVGTFLSSAKRSVIILLLAPSFSFPDFDYQLSGLFFNVGALFLKTPGAHGKNSPFSFLASLLPQSFLSAASPFRPYLFFLSLAPFPQKLCGR